VNLFGQKLFAHLEDFSQSTNSKSILDKSDWKMREESLWKKGGTGNEE